ncbi:hypothetical protein C4J81_01600 [Deltaproteobacteria bacterium Smac51]|nr:hypothetical protein C4J81_01600 [Deltaproteobacteria bacterium Smac51]
MRKISWLLTALLLSLALSATAGADPSRHLTKSLNFCGEPVQLDRNDVYQAVDQNLVLLSEAQSRVWLSLKRAGRFLPVVENELRRAGLPNDLKYIPYSITSFAPEYNSGGRGIWRLRETDARALGLRVDKDVDQRLDPVASTAAAVKRLSGLKNSYGSWTTAMAAYMIGDEAMQKAVSEAGGERDYYKIYLPDGQDNLPSMVLAGKIVFSNPAAFGYHVDSSRLWPAFSGKQATVEQATTARALAAKYGKDYKSFRDINPHLISGTVPAGVTINVP